MKKIVFTKSITNAQVATPSAFTRDVLNDLRAGEMGRCLLRVMTFWGATTRWWESEQF